MFVRLLILFVVVPIVEFYVLFKLATWTSFGATVALVLLTGVLGAWLAKRQGLSTLRRIQRELSEGRLPGQALMDGAMILVAAALLLTPGILTDLFGFSLLTPWCRSYYQRRLLRAPWTVEFRGDPEAFRSGADPSVVDGESSPIADAPPRDED